MSSSSSFAVKPIEHLIVPSQVPSNDFGPGTKLINDTIHSHLELQRYVLDVADTPHTQRLRDLKQLGTTALVFPGATHDRFSHVVGTSFLSGEFVRGIYANRRDPHGSRLGGLFENEAQFERAVQLVETAGLVHDLGHGPFSHAWDSVFLPKILRHGDAFREHPNMQHEARSVMLFEDLVERNGIDLEKDEVRAICAMIQGGKPSGKDNSSLVPGFAYDVVANSKHGLDLDKLDYIPRDCYSLHLPLGFDSRRLMRFAKVVGEDICFHQKEIYSVYQLYLTRFQLHRTVYNHMTALSLDAMCMDAFLEADEALGLSEAILDPTEFLRLSDSTLTMIEHSREQNLKSARDIIYRIRRRKLYRFVDEGLVPPGSTRKMTEQDVVSRQNNNSGIILRPEDIVIFIVKLNFGCGDRNPVDDVLFFKDWEDQNPRYIGSDFSFVVPKVFEERIVRVYLKKLFADRANELRAMETVKAAFRRCIEDFGFSGILSPMGFALHSSTDGAVSDGSSHSKRLRL